MREKKQADFRRRSPSSQPKYRDRTESFPDQRETSTSAKFQWDNLLAEKPGNEKSTENERRSTQYSYSTVVYNSRKYYGLSDNRNRYDLVGPQLQRNEELMARRGSSSSSYKQEEKLEMQVQEQENERLLYEYYRRPNNGGRRKSIVDSIVDKIDGMQRTILDGNHRYLQDTASLRDGEGGGGLGSRSCHVLEDYETLQCGGEEDDGFERGRGSGVHENVYETECTYEQQIYQEMLKRKLMFDLKMNTIENEGFLSNDEIQHDPIYGDEQYWTNEDIQQQLQLSKIPGYEQSPVGRDGWVFDEMVDQRIGDSDDWLPSQHLQQHSSELIETCGGRNIKERLGPASRNIKERLGPASRDIKKRIGPSKSNPWVKNLLRNESLRKNEPLHVRRDDSSKVKVNRAKTETHVQGSESLKVKAKCSKSDPPEDSEEFKKMVHINFLKFVKALNENSALCRKYTEQGGAGTLKCSICSSNSREFIDTLSLAQHAFTSCMVGARAEHLGFHKALCVLMGWNSGAALNSPWVRQILPDGEALALKEDLIIWPPVVFIHNSSIANHNPDERMIVSTEELSAILRGMGFGRGMAKVCHGRPANQSIMVVSFQGTLSGLEEAERLHKFYAKNKYGRAEFKQIDSSSSHSSSGGTQIVPAEKVGNILYGYLGIADDLDKLGFGTKGRCVVKSKKEIQAIAVAPLNSK